MDVQNLEIILGSSAQKSEIKYLAVQETVVKE